MVCKAPLPCRCFYVPCILIQDPKVLYPEFMTLLSTPIVLNGVSCQSTEESLGDCEHLPIVEGCTHSEDAGAFCTNIIGLCGN